MTRKDYELIARAFKDGRDTLSVAGDRAILASCAKDLASALENTNPNFDRTRFLSACGVEN